ncbi:hypothetical protein [Burkholderia stabilis]|uniref:hypothetical protein n=1 Tax=Burkholderia stabilis TaxID=95485 RepID=UPI0010131175|nr:hypothetical protein [Burkholderia stabilis]
MLYPAMLSRRPSLKYRRKRAACVQSRLVFHISQSSSIISPDVNDSKGVNPDSRIPVLCARKILIKPTLDDELREQKKTMTEALVFSP